MLPEITDVCAISLPSAEMIMALPAAQEQLSGQSCAACKVTVNEVSSVSSVFQLTV